MSTYKFKGDSYSPGLYNQPGCAPFSRNIDTAALIADGGLTNTSDVDVSLASTGFAIADILQIFQVSLGFCLRQVGLRVTTVAGAAATVNMGNASATQTHLLGASAAGYMAATSLNALATSIGAVAAAHLGPDNYTGVVFITNGSIDQVYAGAADALSVRDVWAHGFMAF